MKLSEKEKAARKAAFRAMTTAQKLDHIYTYYKGPILLALAVLIAAGSFLHRKLSEKEPVLYLAQVNVSAGADLERDLTGAYLLSLGADPARQEVFLYRDLYLSDNADTLNHEYAYASRMKLMGVIQSQKLDVVVMNREAYDIFSRNGYLADLMDLPALSDPAYAALLAPLLVENDVVLSDNSLEFLLGEADEKEQVTQSVPNALAAASLPLFQRAGFDGDIYLGVVANSPRPEAAAAWLRFVSSSP